MISPVLPTWIGAYARLPVTNGIYRVRLPRSARDIRMQIIDDPSQESDFTLTYEILQENGAQVYSARFSSEDGGGFQLIAKDKSSGLYYPYYLPDGGYGEYKVVEKRGNGYLSIDTFDEEYEALAFRFPETQQDGTEGYRYGIIKILRIGLRKKSNDIWFSLDYAINEKIDDRNSEYAR